MSKSISIVIPSFNEAENIEELYSRIVATLKKINISDYEIIYIENGSTDKSLEILKNLNHKDKSVKIISFSRNFGLQSAIYAGLTEAEKNYVCVLDGDLQDPPELIEDFFNKIDKGFDIVYGIRKKRITNFFKNYCYKLFYFFFSNFSEVHMPSQVGEFCLIKKNICEIIVNFKEKNLFIRGLRSWAGFKQTGIEYERPERNAGKEKFNFLSSFFLGLDGIISFSIFPLRLILLFGIIISFFSILFIIFIFIVKLLSIFQLVGSDSLFLMPKGLTITNILFLFMGSFIILALGIIGEYIAKIYYESKNRPHFIIKEKIK